MAVTRRGKAYVFTIGTNHPALSPVAAHSVFSPSKRYAHSLHCQSAVSMDVHRVDPSLALAFYLPDRNAFQDLVKKMGEVRKLLPRLFPNRC